MKKGPLVVKNKKNDNHVLKISILEYLYDQKQHLALDY